MGRFFAVPFECTLTGRLLCLDSLLLDAIHIINVIGPGEEVEDGRTPNAIDLSQIQVIANLLDNFCLAQHMMVMLVVF